MKNKGNKTEIEKKLPLGAKKLISERTGLTEKTVASILKGKNNRMENGIKVFQEANKIIREYNLAIAK